MKKTVWILAFLVCFISYQGFAGGGGDITKIKEDTTQIKGDTAKIKGDTAEITKIKDDTAKIKEEVEKILTSSQSAQATVKTIPVTPQIAEFLLEKEENSKGVKFYLSNPLTLYKQKETAKIENRNGVIIVNSTNPDEIRITTDSEGIYIPFAEPKNDRSRELQIFFQKQDQTLIFTRRQNNYELSSVIMKGSRSYETKLFDNIQLLFSGEDNREIKVNVVPVDFVTPDPPPRYAQPSDQIKTTGNTGYSSYNAGQRSATSSRRIMGSGSISPARVKEYVRTKKNMTNRDIAIIDKYFEEARFEGVNVDIAIAQMLYWTNNMRNNERVLSRNYGGLSPLPQRNFYGSFTSMTEGVRAHIQHLKGYANVAPNQKIVDPRYYLAVERGFNGITFDQVYRNWSANSRYGQEIDIILRDLSR
jgi:hypothetical protein